tara:strand:+ start:1923 stop:3950 length:2028 start_codon:yes stop_codon:yes gene_type:complete
MIRYIISILLLLPLCNAYVNPIKYNNLERSFLTRYLDSNKNEGPYQKNDLNHLDNANIKNLEKLFYLRNNKYSPFKNIIYMRYKKNNVNMTQLFENLNQEINETILEQEKLNNITDFFEAFNNTNNIIENNLFNNEDSIERANEEAIERMRGYSKFTESPRILIGPISHDGGEEDFDMFDNFKRTSQYQQRRANSEGADDHKFEIIKNSPYNFSSIGGYDKIKIELDQIVDILINRERYSKFNVRTPKGLIFEGPPGNGKTLLAKGFCGEANMSFIPVSGSEFTEKFVGVGAGRVRELFKLARENTPCIIFIDEIDALARKRGNDMISSNSEKDQTLNQLLINLDGFQNDNDIFVIGSTNRLDLLDNALLRPGRMDKKIYIGNPDSDTRKEILKIHSIGKPIDNLINQESIVEMTGGYSGAQIENLLNEAMLYALRDNREMIEWSDLEFVNNRILAGWQDKESKFSEDIIDRIIVHELGHALVGFLSKDHANVMKVVLNMWSPTSPGYTVFENADEDSNIYTKDGLISHLMVLLGGRIAEEIFYGYSVTSGAKQDLEQAYDLSKTMIINYGMGEKNIYPDLSEQSKFEIDKEISKILMEANEMSYRIIDDNKKVVKLLVNKLKESKLITPDDIYNAVRASLISNKYLNLNTQYNRMFKEKYGIILNSTENTDIQD